MKKYLIILPAVLLIIGGAGFLLWAQISSDRSSYPDAKEYAPNFWFDSEEKYYPTNPLNFYYDSDLNELGGSEARAKYDGLSQNEKLDNFEVFYNIDDSGSELVYQYWLFYVFNDGSMNEHYGDWESVFVFINKPTQLLKKIVGSAHNGTEMKAIIANHELTNPASNNVTFLVEKGSHANWPDGNNDGLVSRFSDVTNPFNAYGTVFGIQDWSKLDKLNGLRVGHDSSDYDLRPISEVKDVFGEKYGEDRPLITKKKSPTLAKFSYRFLGREINIKAGGDPPSNAWNKKQFVDSQEVLPLTPTRLARRVDGFFQGAGNMLAAVGRAVMGPFANLFTAQIAKAPTPSDENPTYEPADMRGFAPVGGETPAPPTTPTTTGEPIIAQGQTPTTTASPPTSEDVISDVRSPIQRIDNEPETEVVLVTRVIDGDTVELQSGQKLRYIGINAPETPNGCFSAEATDKNMELVLNKQIILLEGPTESDNFGRLLRFAWQDANLSGTIDAPDVFINLALVEGGYAYAFDFGEAHTYGHRFETAEAAAKSGRLGLWGDACNPMEEEVILNQRPKPIVRMYEPPNSVSPTTDNDDVDDTPPPSPPADETPPDAPTSSIADNTFFNSSSDTNSDEGGYQITLSGTAEASSTITIIQNPTYNATTTGEGDWSSEVTFLNEGANNFFITAKDAAGNISTSTLITLNLDSISPTSTISITNYAIDSDQFKVNWATDSGDVDIYEAEYKIGEAGEWQSWFSGVASSKNYQNAATNTYYFRVRGMDIHGNIGAWKESEAVVIDLYQIVINEIQINDAEFVELYNPTASQISLKDYYFSYYPSSRVTWSGTSTPYGPWINRAFPNSAKIPANGYFLIGVKDYPESGGNPDADWDLEYTTGKLNNSEGTVAILAIDPKSYDNSTTSSQYVYDNRVDAVAWGSGVSLYEQSPAATIPAAGESLTRDSNHSDTDDNSVDFTVATSPTPINSAGETYVPPSPPSNPVWAMYQKDARHSGLATLSGPTWTSNPSSSLWTFEMKKGQNLDGARSQPVIGPDGVVYVTSALGNVYAIDSSDGSQNWKFEPAKNADGGDGTGWASASPALSSDGSVVYSVHTDTENIPNQLILYAIQTTDKTRLWKYSINGANEGFTSPILDSAGNIYVASNTKLYSISSSGNLKWDFSPYSQYSSSPLWIKGPAISEEEGEEYIYITSKITNNIGDRYIFKLDINGNEINKGQLSTAKNLNGAISIGSDGILYTGGYMSYGSSGLYALDPSDLSQDWYTPLGGNVSASLAPNFDADGNIYVGTVITQNTGAFHKVDATGTTVWPFSPDSPSAVQYPAVVDGQGRVYVGAKNKFIYALDSDDGSVIWGYELSDYAVGFAIGQDVVYVVSYDGKVYALK